LKTVETELIDINGVAEIRSTGSALLRRRTRRFRVVAPETVRVSGSLKQRTTSRASRKLPSNRGKKRVPRMGRRSVVVNVVVEGTPSDLTVLESAECPFRAVVNVTNVISRKLLVPVLIR
jgi:hypothetical protein